MAANTDLLRKKKSNFSTTLSSGVNDSTATIPLSSVSGLPTDTAITLTIDRVDANGVSTPSAVERVTGVISGSNLATSLRGQDSTSGLSHASGAVVEDIWDADTWNDLIDALLVGHNQDGTHDFAVVYDSNGNETLKLTGVASAVNEVTIKNAITGAFPKIQATGEADTGINFENSEAEEILILDAIASAVNELTIKNAATGGNPIIQATGGDTDIGINITPKGAGKTIVTANDLGLTTATANIQIAGADPKRAFYVPSNAMFPATTAGCAALAQAESATNDINYKVLDFDQTTEEAAFFVIPSPSYWDLSTITVKFHWTAASGSGDVIWGLAGLARSDDDAIDTAVGTPQTATDTLIATGDLHTSPATAAITIGGTPAKGDFLFFKVYRDADAGGDTLNADARLIGVTITFGIGQYDDQ